MKTIVFIGTHKSDSSREAIKAAEGMGYYTVLLTDQVRFLESREDFPDVHYMRYCDLTDLEEIRRELQKLKLKALDFCAIVSFIDPYCHTASRLAKEYALRHANPKAIHNMQNKIYSRRLIGTSSYVPSYMVLAKDDPEAISEASAASLPLIIKAANSSGSKDVFLAKNKAEFDKCIEMLNKRASQSPIIVEEYLDGPQYLIEVVVYDQLVNIVAVFKQVILFEERFIVTGYQLMLNIPPEFYESLEEAVQFVVKSHGLDLGGCHLEFRYVDEAWKLVEINPRISGGGMNRMIEIGLGINLVKETLKVALGEVPDLQPKKLQHTFAKYLTVKESGILKKVTGKKKALESPGVQEVYVKPKKGTMLTPPLSMGQRYAYVIATGSNAVEAKANAISAAGQINFHLAPPDAKE